MLSVELCKKILNKKEKKYSNEQVKVIRDYLYQMALVFDDLKIMFLLKFEFIVNYQLISK